MAKAPARQRVGEVRCSQLLSTYGVGAIVDLPSISVMVMGLDAWDPPTPRTEISEERLLALVRNHLGEQVERLCLPPVPPDANGTAGNPFDPSTTIGVPVTPFPRWVRCPRCELLAPLDFGVFALRQDPYRPDRTRYLHTNCRSPGKPPQVVPARFVVACEHGHLDDFPWHYYAHGADRDCRSVFRLRELGISAEAADIFVVCETCGSKRSLALAFGRDGAQYLPGCSGSHAHLRHSVACAKPVRAMLSGASNLWFPVSISSLAIPSADGRLEQAVSEHWSTLSTATSHEILDAFRKIGQLEAFAEWSLEEVWSAVEQHRTAPQPAAPRRVAEIKVAEWDIFSRPDQALAGPDFELHAVAPPPGYERVLSQVVMVRRLRVVKALTGFTRIDSPGDYADVSEIPEPKRVVLARRPPSWLPASEVRGEGLFLRFREEPLANWEARVSRPRAEFSDAHHEFRRVRNIENPAAGFPGVRFVLLHSLAHALIRELSIACGYAAASLQERIYARDAGSDAPMAGILLFTAAADSEGTLGGLVSLGEPKTLAYHLDEALEQMRLCASDPLCAEHRPLHEGVSLHGAACHACLFVSETSCERGNKYLDRGLLVETVGGDPEPFFERVVRGE